MGGKGSGRPRNVEKRTAETYAKIAEAGGENIILPNMSGTKDTISSDAHNISTDDLAEGSTNLYDKTVTLTNGANISITGTYPNFTIAASGGGGSYTAGTGLNLSGSQFSTNDTEIDHSNLSGSHNLTTDIDHNNLTNTHNLTTDIEHPNISGSHNMTTDIDSRIDSHLSGGTGISYSSGTISSDDANINHDNLNYYVANEHIDWTGCNDNISCQDLTLSGSAKTTEDLTASGSEYFRNMLIGTESSPPAASSVAQGTLYVQYTA